MTDPKRFTFKRVTLTLDDPRGALQTAMEAARINALEEAAQIAERHGYEGQIIADEIRRVKGAKPR